MANLYMLTSARLFLCILLAFSFGVFNSLQAQSTWELKKDKNGIKVFTMNTESAKYKKVKVECETKGTLARLDSILQAVENNKNWVYSTKTAYRIKTISDKDFIYYAESAMPWPLENRDVVIHMLFNRDSIRNMLFITASGEPDFIPKKSNIVRLPHFQGRYIATQKNQGQLTIIYYLDIDPGGNTPAWLVNMFVAKGPYETFRNLSAMLQR